MIDRIGRRTIDVGDVSGVADGTSWHEIPEDFSNAVTLIVSIHAPVIEPATARLNWRISDSIDDGERWSPLEDTSGACAGL
jgi:hypothetical protein